MTEKGDIPTDSEYESMEVPVPYTTKKHNPGIDAAELEKRTSLNSSCYSVTQAVDH